MILKFNTEYSKNYKNKSQQIRVMSEHWVEENIFCPNCGIKLKKFINNKPVADFYCSFCKEEFELKSKKGITNGNKIISGEYFKTLERINSLNNPNFFFLTYDENSYSINNFMAISKNFFIDSIIEKRKPLSKNAKRSGWTGCNILINEIPHSAKIYYIKSGIISDKKYILEKWKKLNIENNSINSRGWFFDIISLTDKIKSTNFNLKDVYAFENELKLKHPNNKNIKAKIRQQLQILRDKNIIKFLGNGFYEKNNEDISISPLDIDCEDKFIIS